MNNKRVPRDSLALLLAAGSWLAAGAAQASVTVSATAPDVSYSQNATIGLVSYVGYEYTVTNAGAASATATIAGTAASGVTGQTPVFVSTVGGVAIPESAGCKVGKTTNGFSCSFSVAARTTVKRVVYFRAPDKLSTNTLANGTQANCAQGVKGIDCLRLTTSSAKIGTATYTVGTSFAGLGTDPTLAFKTASPSLGATYYTGRIKGGLSSADDPASTIVTVPRTGTSKTLNGYTIANLIEKTYPKTQYPGCANWTNCYGTQLTIPVPSGSKGRLDTGALAFETPLRITLRRHTSQLGVNLPIGQITVYYTPDSGSYSTTVALGLCPAASTPLTNGIPCITSATVVGSEYVWTLLNLRNGKYWVDYVDKSGADSANL